MTGTIGKLLLLISIVAIPGTWYWATYDTHYYLHVAGRADMLNNCQLMDGQSSTPKDADFSSIVGTQSDIFWSLDRMRPLNELEIICDNNISPDDLSSLRIEIIDPDSHILELLAPELKQDRSYTKILLHSTHPRKIIYQFAKQVMIKFMSISMILLPIFAAFSISDRKTKGI